MAGTLTSKRLSVQDEAEAVETAFEKGWSDGLPIVPPTEARVRAMLEAARLEPGQQVGFVAHRAVSITAEKVAINAVMAGCRPEYMPVVVAAVEGIADPRWSYHGPGTSTGGAGVLMIVNGPVARALDINAGDNLFGPGWRANLTIGRAVRLVMRSTLSPSRISPFAARIAFSAGSYISTSGTRATPMAAASRPARNPS